MFSKSSIKVGLVALVAFSLVATVAYATHSWGNYHWARKVNPFTVKLGDNVSTSWDAYLAEASTDWSQSNVLDTTVVTGKSNSNCRPTAGRVEACSRKYGFNGWLGVASIWVSGNHITRGTVKVNDSYFNTTTYNKPEWRRFVMCQEVGHTFGLDHQDENFSNPNLGTCMDYTSIPAGPPSNEHPNTHDYEQLGLIYTHLDSITTVSQAIAHRGNRNNEAAASDHRTSLTQNEQEREEDLGKELRKTKKGKTSLYEHDLGKGEKVFTFILWTEE